MVGWGPFEIAFINFQDPLAVGNGILPVITVIVVIPKLHISVSKLYSASPRIRAGDMYPSVPIKLSAAGLSSVIFRGEWNISKHLIARIVSHNQ
jgi:hypothetical protein